MRITILANEDLASIVAINLLLQQQPTHQYRVFLSAKVGGDSARPLPLQYLSFIEQSLFSQILFPALESRIGPPKNKLNTFFDLARRKITVAKMEDINSETGQQVIAAGKPNLIISIRFGQILSKPVIEIPEYGVINLHSGVLPAYRGVMATFWAMYNSEQQIGTTLHYISDKTIDTGDIIATSTQSLNLDKSYLSNVLSLYPAGTELISDAINSITKNQPIATKHQASGTGQYYSFPTEQDLKTFSERGHQLFCFDEINTLAKQFF